MKRFNDLPYWSVRFPLEIAGFVAILWLMVNFGPLARTQVGELVNAITQRLTALF